MPQAVVKVLDIREEMLEEGEGYCDSAVAEVLNGGDGTLEQRGGSRDTRCCPLVAGDNPKEGNGNDHISDEGSENKPSQSEP